MKRFFNRKEFLLIGVAVILFLVVSVLSIKSISMLAGNARVVNYVGIVRGATQKLVKEELMGYPDDELITRLDSIVEELLSGEGPNGLQVLQDENYINHMVRIQAHWSTLKELIYEVRAGAPPDELFDSSQEYFELANDTVFAAEAFSERQVNRIRNTIVSVIVVFMLFLVAGLALMVRGFAVSKRARELGKIAYVDPLTQIDNRASCERMVHRLNASPPAADLAALIFDMNDLKMTNDFLGHQGGDKIIADFANILKREAAAYGFVGRYGGDEFLGVLKNANEQTVKDFLAQVALHVEEYNNVKSNLLEQIHYAVGYAIGTPASTNLQDLIHTADSRMYEDKRRYKSGL